ncbi:hypothetical protein BD289DRAFT_75536 [Coniella lustricola]|uniref:Uncharacterized protein n=1 Tax=Coniella lustricola TaxID=2025994 RepID=A0A2T2ZZL4_9PEZI|nr:hypothetical protein BD289DRAFT_75536 [Coniella lustricola]
MAVFKLASTQQAVLRILAAAASASQGSSEDIFPILEKTDKVKGPDGCKLRKVPRGPQRCGHRLPHVGARIRLETRPVSSSSSSSSLSSSCTLTSSHTSHGPPLSSLLGEQEVGEPSGERVGRYFRREQARPAVRASAGAQGLAVA